MTTQSQQMASHMSHPLLKRGQTTADLCRHDMPLVSWTRPSHGFPIHPILGFPQKDAL